MSSPIWYLGPDWDLQPLICPEPNIDITPVRYGGVFQGLSGARSMTITGVKQQFAMELRYLTPEEYDRLEALQYRRIPGPFRLLSPFKINRLSPQGSMAEPVSGISVSNTGFAVSKGSIRQTLDWPSAAGTSGALSTVWSISETSSAYGRFDAGYRFPVVPGQAITCSVFLKTSVSTPTIWLYIDWFDKNGLQLAGTTQQSTNPTASWARYSAVGTPPAGAYSARLALVGPSAGFAGNDLYVAAAQAEVGSSATAWSPGGAAPRVLMDQLGVATPRFPYVTTNLTLLEA